jgi:hypothetical protein
MSSVFISAAVCSALASSIYGSDGWHGVSILGGGLGLAGLLIWGVEQLTRLRRDETVDASEAAHELGA